MKLLRLLAPVLVAASLMVACSGDDGIADSLGTSSSGGRTSSSGSSGPFSGSSTSGNTTPPSSSGFSGSSSSSSGFNPSKVYTENLESMLVGRDACGKAPGTCADAQSFAVDFVKKTLTHITCVETAGFDGGLGKTTDAKETRPLDEKELAILRADLEAMTISSKPFDGFDGPLEFLEVKANGKSIGYSPFAGCSKDKFSFRIESGFQQLWDDVRAL